MQWLRAEVAGVSVRQHRLLLTETESSFEIELLKDPTLQKTQLQAALTDERKSGRRKYQELVVGTQGLISLIRYEVITTVCGYLPGALGLVLRRQMFPQLLAWTGRGTMLGRSITLRHPHKVGIGSNVIIDDLAVLDANGTANRGITLGDNVMIGRNTVLSCKDGDITIGDNTHIAMNCFIQSAREVRIGRNVLMAAYCYVIGGGDHRADRTDIPIIAQGQVVRGVTIEDNVWIGAGALIQDGVTIGRDAIIGSGAVVTRDIPAFGVAAGVPARVIRNRNHRTEEESRVTNVE